MSGRQGEVDSVKSFAADAAGNEERARTGRQIMDLKKELEGAKKEIAAARDAGYDPREGEAALQRMLEDGTIRRRRLGAPRSRGSFFYTGLRGCRRLVLTHLSARPWTATPRAVLAACPDACFATFLVFLQTLRHSGKTQTFRHSDTQAAP